MKLLDTFSVAQSYPQFISRISSSNLEIKNTVSHGTNNPRCAQAVGKICGKPCRYLKFINKNHFPIKNILKVTGIFCGYFYTYRSHPIGTGQKRLKTK